ncbi:HotDog domain-containing protein [Mycena rebaudengoi]|nr:HotDog domain-containing protein [Mycena rebaudengoi]
MPPPWEIFLRSLPTVDIDVKQIRGNVSDAEKQVNANIFAYFATGSGSGVSPNSPFSKEIGGRLKIVEMNVRDLRSNAAAAEVVFEIEVTENMSNVYGTLHGGCAAYMVDPCTVASLILLGLESGFDGTGVTQSMNLHWHHPAPLGSTLIITTTSTFSNGRARLARCEIREKGSGKLILSGVHSFLNAGKAVKL